MLAIVSALLMAGGSILFMFGGITAKESERSVTLQIIGGGILIIFVGAIFCGVSYVVVESQAEGRIRQVVARESSKYSHRVPAPCTWRVLKWEMFNQAYGQQEQSRRTYFVREEDERRAQEEIVSRLPVGDRNRKSRSTLFSSDFSASASDLSSGGSRRLFALWNEESESLRPRLSFVWSILTTS